MNTDLLDVDGVAAPPRRNGALAFDAPWQSRVFGLCAAIIETCFGGDREPFRQKLVVAIAAEPDRPYWNSWTVALQKLVVETGLLDASSIDSRMAASPSKAIATGSKTATSAATPRPRRDEL